MLQYKYNPQNAPPDELKKTFTARKELLSVIIDEITNLRKSKSNQHYLIIGPRGIGKTNLLQLIYLNIKEDDKLSNSFMPLQFAEEEYSIGNLRDFLEKMIEILIEESYSIEAEECLEQLESENDDKIASDRAIELLKNQSRIEKKKFIVFVDNLDLILDEQFKDKMETKKLRDILMNEEFMILISAAPTYFDEVSKYDKPLYNFFKIINLNDLNEFEVEELIKNRAKFDGNFELIKKLELYRPKIKALKHLTGGNPRLILMIYQVLTLSEFSEVKNYLNELLDDLTPYYQYKLKMLAPQQRKIVEAIAKLNKAVSPTEIARATRLEVNKVSSNIKRLVDDGYIKIGEQARRKSTLYIISERLFRIWYQMRHSRSMRRKIEMFVEFIQIWYSKEELEKESNRLSDKFYKHLSAKETAKAKNIIEHLDYIAAANHAPEKKSEIEDSVIQMMFEINDLDNAEKKLLDKKRECKKTSNSEELAHCLFGLGILNANKEKFNEALESYDEALEIKPEYQDAWVNRGSALSNLGKYEEALKSYDEALKIKPDSYQAWNNRGNSLFKMGKYKEAIKSFDEALKIKPDFHHARINRGATLSKLGKHEEAIKIYDEAIKLKSDDHLVWNNRGNSLSALSKHKEAIKSFDEALKIKPDFQDAWYNHGNTLSDLGKYKEAIKSYDEAIKLKPDDHQTWNNRGSALSDLRKHKEAIKSFDEAIKLKPDDHQAWYNKGTSLSNLKKYEEALNSFNEGIHFVEDDDVKKFFYFQILQSYLVISSDEVLSENRGNAVKTFNRGLEYLEMVYSEKLSESINKFLIQYFDIIISQKNSELVNELLSKLLQKGLKNEYEFLEPYRIAAEYWLKDKDRELVLDILNPEVREIVQKIIEKGKNK